MRAHPDFRGLQKGRRGREVHVSEPAVCISVYSRRRNFERKK
jgi:hypothetical protein